MIIYYHLIKNFFQSVKKVDLKFDPDLIQNNNKNKNTNTPSTPRRGIPEYHSSVLELRKNQFLKKINVLKTFLEIETTHYLEGLDLKLNNETYAKVPNL